MPLKLLILLPQLCKELGSQTWTTIPHCIHVFIVSQKLEGDAVPVFEEEEEVALFVKKKKKKG